MNTPYIHLVNKISSHCLTTGLTLATAESVTSGYLQFLISQCLHASFYYQGGITVYTDTQKLVHLGISPELSAQNHAVTPIVAELLAIGATNMFQSDIGVGITGFAGIDKDLGIDAVYAFMAIALKGKVILRKKLTAHYKIPHCNQIDFSRQCLYHLCQVLDKSNKRRQL